MKKLILIVSFLIAGLSNTAIAQSAHIGSIVANTSQSVEKWAFILAGQSNMRPNTGFTGDGNTENFPTDYLQWGRFGAENNTLIQAVKPLDHVANDGTPQYGPGIGVRFANNLKELYPNVLVAFIPTAQGSTGFAGDDWNKGDFNYEDMVARTNLFMSENPEYKLKGFLWHQGESDAGNTNFDADFTNFNANWRVDITVANATTPFVCGGLLRDYIISAGAGARNVNNFLANLPNTINYTGFADSESPTILTGYDGIHFTSDSSLILGDRFFDAWLRAMTNN